MFFGGFLACVSKGNAHSCRRFPFELWIISLVSRGKKMNNQPRIFFPGPIVPLVANWITTHFSECKMWCEDFRARQGTSRGTSPPLGHMGVGTPQVHVIRKLIHNFSVISLGMDVFVSFVQGCAPRTHARGHTSA